MTDSQRRIDQFFCRRDIESDDIVDGKEDSADVSNHDELDSHSDTDKEEAGACLAECECQCCSNVSTPYHPVELSDSKKPSCITMNAVVLKSPIQE